MSPAEGSIRVRFAPSPTGDLHAGNARTALINACMARRSGGSLVLRIDDTDLAREQANAVSRQIADLDWLGITADERYAQSERQQVYEEACSRLSESGHLADDGGAKRLRLPAAAVAWDDAIQGSMRLEPKHLKAPVLVRADGSPTYMLASVVDDIDLTISHVIRGADHLTNTALHLILYRALGAAEPIFAHLPLLTDPAGAPLSKRNGALSLAQLRERGVEPEPLAAYLIAMGTGAAPSPAADFAASETPFELGAYGAAAPVFALDELSRVQERWLQAMQPADLDRAVARRGLPPVEPAVWAAFRGALGNKHAADPLDGLPRLERLADWHRIVQRPLDVATNTEDRAYLDRAAAALPADSWTPAALEAWIAELAAETGRKGKSLRLPLRLALTGRPDGPPLPDLVALMDRDRVQRRLLGEAA